MMNFRNMLFVVFCFVLVNTAKTQPSLETYVTNVSHFVLANYSKKDLSKIKSWSDSSWTENDKKKRVRHLWYRGKIISKEGARIEFTFASSELKATGEKLTSGFILFSHRGDCDVLLQPVLQYITESQFNYDTLYIKNGMTCSIDKIYIHFDNYNPSTNKVIQNIDTSLTKLLKREYFDFYFGDVNKATSIWQTEFKTFMQLYSDALIALLKKKNIPGIFKVMALPNKGYSWFLAEGLWYYNSLHPCLTPEQMKIIDAYNGKNGMITFRPAEDLRLIYKF